MKQGGYVELHLHTSYSFLDGASQPEDLVLRAAELGYQALAITDHDGLYGALEFARLCQVAGIQPITGAEITLVDGTHLTLLAETQQGYRNLCRLITQAHHTVRVGAEPLLADEEVTDWIDAQAHDTVHHYRLPDVSPWHDPMLLPQFAEGLILLTGCRSGKLPQLVDANRMKDAHALLSQYAAWFGSENVFVELQCNYVFGDQLRTQRLVRVANEAGVGYVATGNVHYHLRDRHRLQDVLVAIRHRATLDGCHRQRRPNAEFHLASAAEMAVRFAEFPEALSTSVEIARRCSSFNLNQNLGYQFPDYADVKPGETPDDALRRLCFQPFAVRYPIGSPRYQEAVQRLEQELGLIKQHKLAGFFLIHHDLLELAREVAIEIRGADTYRAKALLPPGRGRGSSVSSIVCYLIGLSPVDPLEHGLSVGRFLNDGSSAVPDIDLDFPRDIRERLLARIHEDYGDRAAMVCAFSTYKLRSAVRDVGKALGIPSSDLDAIAKGAEPGSATALAKELDRSPTYALRKAEPPWSFLIELAEQLAGHPRHITQHSGGMIVSSGPITDIVPVQPAAMDGRFLAQWDKDSADDAGFVKIDFLALGMLSSIEECMTLIGQSGDPVPDLSRINFADPAIFAMIREGDTLGTFQIESRAQIQTTLRTAPSTLADLVLQVAIVRPGPIVGGATTPYIQRRLDPNWQPTYDHPRLEPVLRDTLGVVVYQDQVIEVAQALAGFTAGQADSLRRAMTRKRSIEAIEAHRKDFLAGAAVNGVDQATAETVFKKLRGFAEYGFPRGHAASFGVLAYHSCYLKYYHPAEFLCSLLNNQPMGFYPPHVLVHEGKRRGVLFAQISIATSQVLCSVPRRGTIQIGLGQVKGLRDDDAERIVAERERNGSYRSLADFIRRVPIPHEVIARMIQVGAFDSFGLGKRELLWQIGLFIRPIRFGLERENKKRGRKRDLIAGMQRPLPMPIEQDMVTLPTTPTWERMVADYQILGLSPLYHPMGLKRRELPTDLVKANQLEQIPHDTVLRIGGLVVVRQRPETAKGVTFLLLEDETGLSNIVVYGPLYDAYRPLVRGEPFLLITGRMQRQGDTINIVATKIEPLDQQRRGRVQESEEMQSGENLKPATHSYR
ncbi:error-prone DNA polymerase [soil metagenome]